MRKNVHAGVEFSPDDETPSHQTAGRCYSATVPGNHLPCFKGRATGGGGEHLVKNIAAESGEELSQTVRYETPVIMGTDEVNLAGGYRCVITQSGNQQRNFDMLEHRTQEHLKPFFKDFSDVDKVEWVCTDIWRPFKRSFAQYLP
ncbi:transposase [Klebsiella pneumoniae]|uniref:transposase n=1 Tax=Klebsiella pneumoniae TaxID=573 RepID=UPI0039BE63FF